MSKCVIMSDTTYGALVGLLEGIREEHFKGKERLNMFEKAFQGALDNIECAVLGASDNEFNPPEFLTCSFVDIQEFIQNNLEHNGSSKVVVDGAHWDVQRDF